MQLQDSTDLIRERKKGEDIHFMYSFGSSARAGVGKRGHGGRDYRPPRNRRDPNATPPPLKQCSCLCQLELEEYATTAAVRHHVTFGGRERQEELERQMRAQFLVHLVIPGRKQSGPVAVVGETYRESLAAVAYLLQYISSIGTWTSPTIRGRIQWRVQDPNDIVLEGHWRVPRPILTTDVVSLMETSWLFQGPEHWNALVCYLPTTLQTTDGGEQATTPSSAQEENIMTTLHIAFDNLKFKMGNLDGIEIFLHDNPFMALAVGTPSRMTVLYQEMEQALQKPQDSTNTNTDGP